MVRAMVKFPFEVPFEQVLANIDEFASIVFTSLESEFLILPKGQGFIEYAVFETGYEALKRATSGFTNLTVDTLLSAASESPIAIIVLRAMLGFTHPNGRILPANERGSRSARASLVRWIEEFGWLR